MSDPAQLSASSLSDLPAGSVGHVESLSLDRAQAARMAGLGISVGRRLRVLRAGEPLVIQVYGSQIGLARSIARHVFVRTEPVEGR